MATILERRNPLRTIEDSPDKQEALLLQKGRDICFMSVCSVQYLERSLLLLVTSASDILVRTLKLCSVEDSYLRQDSPTRGASSPVSCDKHTPPLATSDECQQLATVYGGSLCTTLDGCTVDNTR